MAEHFFEGIPYYLQIKEDLRRRIVSAEISSGARIPGEMELARSYGVSRPTVRQAIQALVQDGLLVRSKGRGTFVRTPPAVDSAEMFTLFGDGGGVDNDGWSRAVEVRRAAASGGVPAALGLPPGSEVFEISLRYLRRGEPVALRRLSVPPHVMPDLAERLRTEPLGAVLGALGLAGGTALQTFQAAKCSAWEAALLGLDPGEPVTVWTGVLYGLGAEARAHVETVFRGDRIAFTIRQGRPVVRDVADGAGGGSGA